MKKPTFVTDSVSLLPTDDGSLTLYHHGHEASYRSTSGARTESRHVFLEGTGLFQRLGEWRVLELGLGGALNFLVTATEALKRENVVTLRYWAVEHEPLPPSLFDNPDYTDWVTEPALLPLLQDVLQQAHDTPRQWVEAEIWVPHTMIQLSLFAGEWKDAPLLPVEVDAVYHDPFAPSVNPDAWTPACFGWSASQMSPVAQLATYSAAGSVRCAMTAAGLHWRKIPGTGRKREITVASLVTCDTEYHA